MPRAQCVKHLSVLRWPNALAVSQGKSATTVRSLTVEVIVLAWGAAGNHDFAMFVVMTCLRVSLMTTQQARGKTRNVHVVLTSIVCLIVYLQIGLPMRAATVATGFSETLVASGLSSPTAMQFAPDGRLFVAEQGGRLRVITAGVLLPTPFLTVTVSSVGERGLLGVAFDPQFATNQFVYVYYTATSPNVHNRISRFTADGDVAATGSQKILLDLNILGSANHNGGALAFGPDGKLYAAVGENTVGDHAQSLANLGVEYGQGYYFGRPERPMALINVTGLGAPSVR